MKTLSKNKNKIKQETPSLLRKLAFENHHSYDTTSMSSNQNKIILKIQTTNI